MKRLAAAASVVLVAACSHSVTPRASQAKATTTVASTATTSGGPTTSGALAPACAAADLVVAGINDDGASGHSLHFVDLKNVSDAPCSLSGFPTLTGATRDGVALSDVHNGAYAPSPRPGNVEPGLIGTVTIDVYNRCSDDYPDKPIGTYVDVHIGLPGGGTISLGDFAIGPTCLVGVSELGVSQ